MISEFINVLFIFIFANSLCLSITINNRYAQ